MPSPTEFRLPDWFHLAAVFFAGGAGALAAIRRRYDVVGVAFLSLVSGLGGALVRDVVLQRGVPSIFLDGRYILTVVFAGLVAYAFGHKAPRIASVLSVSDAIGLAAYAVIGAQMSVQAGVSLSASVVVGMVNAVGGGLIRDILVREEPIMFRPGHFYALAAAAGSTSFVLLHRRAELEGGLSGAVAVAVAFLIRILAVRYDWKTRPMEPSRDEDRGSIGD
jgi:uncharacterized membrane protein YeiH